MTRYFDAGLVFVVSHLVTMIFLEFSYRLRPFLSSKYYFFYRRHNDAKEKKYWVYYELLLPIFLSLFVIQSSTSLDFISGWWYLTLFGLALLGRVFDKGQMHSFEISLFQISFILLFYMLEPHFHSYIFFNNSWIYSSILFLLSIGIIFGINFFNKPTNLHLQFIALGCISFLGLCFFEPNEFNIEDTSSFLIVISIIGLLSGFWLYSFFRKETCIVGRAIGVPLIFLLNGAFLSFHRSMQGLYAIPSFLLLTFLLPLSVVSIHFLWRAFMLHSSLLSYHGFEMRKHRFFNQIFESKKIYFCMMAFSFCNMMAAFFAWPTLRVLTNHNGFFLLLGLVFILISFLVFLAIITEYPKYRVIKFFKSTVQPRPSSYLHLMKFGLRDAVNAQSISKKKMRSIVALLNESIRLDDMCVFLPPSDVLILLNLPTKNNASLPERLENILTHKKSFVATKIEHKIIKVENVVKQNKKPFANVKNTTWLS